MAEAPSLRRPRTFPPGGAIVAALIAMLLLIAGTVVVAMTPVLGGKASGSTPLTPRACVSQVQDGDEFYVGVATVNTLRDSSVTLRAVDLADSDGVESAGAPGVYQTDGTDLVMVQPAAEIEEGQDWASLRHTFRSIPTRVQADAENIVVVKIRVRPGESTATFRGATVIAEGAEGRLLSRIASDTTVTFAQGECAE